MTEHEAQLSDPEIVREVVKEEATRRAQEATEQHLAQYKRRIDWDVRGIIAVIAIIGVFAIAAAQLILRGDANVPTWAATLVGGVTGFYFGSRGGTVNGQAKRKDD